MPTIHLSLPEQLYDELKSKAEEMGVQITDLVKFFIKQGLEGKLEKDEDARIEKYEENVAFLEAKVAQLDALVSELIKRLKALEEEDEEEEEIEIRENA